MLLDALRPVAGRLRPPAELAGIAGIAGVLVAAGAIALLADRLRSAGSTARILAFEQMRSRAAAEENDSMVQSLAVAKWAFEAGERDRGLELLTGAMERAERVAVDLIRRPTPDGAPWAGRRVGQVPEGRDRRSSSRTA